MRDQRASWPRTKVRTACKCSAFVRKRMHEVRIATQRPGPHRNRRSGCRRWRGVARYLQNLRALAGRSRPTARGIGPAEALANRAYSAVVPIAVQHVQRSGRRAQTLPRSRRQPCNRTYQRARMACARAQASRLTCRRHSCQIIRSCISLRQTGRRFRVQADPQRRPPGRASVASPRRTI